MITKNRRIAVFVLGCIFLLFFYFFSHSVKGGFLKQADFDMTVRIQDHMPVRLDGIWENLTFFVEPAPSIIIVGLLTIVAFVDWKKRKVRFQALLIPLLFGLLVLGETYGKSVVHHPAPPFFMIKHPTAMFPQFYINEQYSYPSGHTARAVFLGIVFVSLVANNLALAIKNLKRWVVIVSAVSLYVLLVAVGKIYLGQHWLSDVIGGLLLGAGMGCITGIM